MTPPPDGEGACLDREGVFARDALLAREIPGAAGPVDMEEKDMAAGCMSR